MRCSIVLLVLLMPACGSPGAAPNEDASLAASARAPDPIDAIGGVACRHGACRVVARPIAPLSTSRVTTTRPTLRWALPDHARGARVEICSDRACAHVLVSRSAIGDHLTLAQPLPAGVVYWRLRPLPGHPRGATSPTWELFVGAASVDSVDSSSGSTFDVDGDGHADAAVTTTLDGRLFVFPGGASGLATAPAVTIDLSASGRVGGIADAGDVDGDGFADLLVASGDQLQLFRGGPAGLETVATDVLPLAPGLGDRRHAFAGIGDFDGDGYADIVVADPPEDRALVYFGAPSGFDMTRALALGDPDLSATSGFGAAVAGVGDVDGDGLGDVVIGAPSASGGDGRAYLYRGGATDGVASATFTPPDAGGAFGFDVSAAGDVDGNGKADVLIGAPQAPNASGYHPGRAYVFPSSGCDAPGDPIVLVPPLMAHVRFGAVVASAGDQDGDGFDEVAVVATIPTPESGSLGQVAVFRGSASGTVTTSWEMFADGSAGGHFGEAIASPGDVDGDLRSDLLVGASSSPTSLGGSRPGAGRVSLFAGAPAASSSATQTLRGEDYGVRGFGAAVE